MSKVKPAGITNVVLCNQALSRTIDRAHTLPGLLVWFGYSGLGKTMSAVNASIKNKGFYVQCKSTQTRKSFLESILKEMGIAPAKNLSDMTDQICVELMQSHRPLIIDEADYLVDKNKIMMVMDIYEGSQAAIMLVGEEKLPAKLSVYEKIHNRVLDWVAAQPCEAADVEALARMFAPSIKIEPEVLEGLNIATKGVARRIVTDLNRMVNFARDEGIDEITVTNYTLPFTTGQAPRGRKL
tara:strand:+ start:4809 stop:5528 length:720 start_codon:yes stop_codon:yes gene_type:complete